MAINSLPLPEYWVVLKLLDAWNLGSLRIQSIDLKIDHFQSFCSKSSTRDSTVSRCLVNSLISFSILPIWRSFFLSNAVWSQVEEVGIGLLNSLSARQTMHPLTWHPPYPTEPSSIDVLASKEFWVLTKPCVCFRDTSILWSSKIKFNSKIILQICYLYSWKVIERMIEVSSMPEVHTVVDEEWHGAWWCRERMVIIEMGMKACSVER